MPPRLPCSSRPRHGRPPGRFPGERPVPPRSWPRSPRAQANALRRRSSLPDRCYRAVRRPFPPPISPQNRPIVVAKTRDLQGWAPPSHGGGTGSNPVCAFPHRIAERKRLGLRGSGMPGMPRKRVRCYPRCYPRSRCRSGRSALAAARARRRPCRALRSAEPQPRPALGAGAGPRPRARAAPSSTRRHRVRPVRRAARGCWAAAAGLSRAYFGRRWNRIAGWGVGGA
jgi:hypothetical protein